MQTYLYLYLSSAFVAIIITPIVIKFAMNIKAVDRPGVRTVHKRPVPRIGGTAIFISFMFVIVIVMFMSNEISEAFRNMQKPLTVLFCSATLIFIVGFFDDLKGLPAKFKFLTEIISASALCFAGVKITSISITDQAVLNLGILSCPLSILWIVGITNAVNLSDGLDGLAAGISAVAFGVILVLAIYNDQVIMAVIMLIMLGSLTGFLFFNFNPAKIFLGDCGSLFLGFMIRSLSILCSMKSSALVGLALPVLTLGVPIFDTFFSMLRRFLERRSIFSPDRNHFHHKLIDLGIKQRHVVITIYVITLLVTGLGMFMMVTRDINTLVIFFCILLLLFLVFHVVGSVRLRETIAGLQRKYTITRQIKHEKKHYEDAELYFRRAVTFNQWWDAIGETAQRLNFAWISLKTKNEDCTISTNIWRTADKQVDFSKLIIINIPHNNNDDFSYEFEIAVSFNGSYESAGHRVTLFARLLDEYNINSNNDK